MEHSNKSAAARLGIFVVIVIGWFLTVANSAGPSYEREMGETSGDFTIAVDGAKEEYPPCQPVIKLGMNTAKVTLTKEGETVFQAVCPVAGLDCLPFEVDTGPYRSHYVDPHTLEDVSAADVGSAPDAAAGEPAQPMPYDIPVSDFDCSHGGKFKVTAERVDGTSASLEFTQYIVEPPGYLDCDGAERRAD